MDSFSSSQGFVNLLTSQEEQTFCFSQSQDLGSHEVPRFSSQVPDQRNVKERRKWSPVEDVALISAWLNTSKDPIISNEQKVDAFWKRITTYFNSSKQLVNEQDRESGQLKQRWQRINDHVSKFVGCYEAALKAQTSGQNENDMMKTAQQIFYNDSSNGGKGKRRKLGETSAHSSNSQTQDHGDDVSMARPPGVKASKAAKKKAVGTSGAKEAVSGLNDIKSMYEMKERDLAMKDKITNKKLLDSLLCRAEPLSEREEALKTKLINELLA
ncbi:glutathione S-transferase T3-like [Eutrema salsugineum]|uniref:glutathione S-transferase T3-like n=1 Tax=Eutrema salsugineum TaxID=72664 RepID=UPI000CED22ED|nr:glutathione S-transferase T3-like [Eutrema salsugineum]